MFYYLQRTRLVIGFLCVTRFTSTILNSLLLVSRCLMTNILHQNLNRRRIPVQQKRKRSKRSVIVVQVAQNDPVIVLNQTVDVIQRVDAVHLVKTYLII
ncbi:unnamed protein product [Adineta ricciae]|uniref:Uncharacterized protein n=1 Tax=Adineta ricciae TaxID=249248 RepID=A0A814IV21_ADIRI|nr:unnamed protein product [Adineta ricciae]